MKKNWIVTLAACMVFSLSLSGCGTATDTASSTTSSESSSEAETSGKSEQDLMDEENNILEKNKDLWEKVFASMDKNVTSDTLSSNYGDVLMQNKFARLKMKLLHFRQIPVMNRPMPQQAVLFRNLRETIWMETK